MEFNPPFETFIFKSLADYKLQVQTPVGVLHYMKTCGVFLLHYPLEQNTSAQAASGKLNMHFVFCMFSD